MRKSRMAILVGVGLIIGGVALATEHNSHVLNVAMPDGTIAEIRYVGDVAPKVRITPMSTVSPVFFTPFDDAPFSMFDRISMDMDRQMNALMQQVSAMARVQPGTEGKMDIAAWGKLPAGTVHYSYFSSTNGKASCSQSVQMTSAGPGQQPKVVSQSSGDCSKMGIAPIPASAPSAAPAAQADQPKLAPVKYEVKPETAKDRNTI